ncbi:MAG TPA: RNA polymerase sigma factor [Gaiellaceae bacterium]|nr:RNA polymerase sigma factor [Gaiellaceae bacterium]
MATVPVDDPRDRAFERLYERYVRDVYRYVLAVLRNPAEAEDVTQTTFLNAYRAMQAGEEPQKPQHWLIAIAHNACRSRARFAVRRPREVPIDDLVEQLPTLEPDRPNVRELLRALGRLPFNQRQAITMREFEGRSYVEIADSLGVTVPAAEALISRARRSLRLQATAIRGLVLVQVPRSLRRLVAGGGAAGNAAGAKVAAVLVAGAVAGGVGYVSTGPSHARSGASRAPLVEAVVAPKAAQPARAHRVEAVTRRRAAVAPTAPQTVVVHPRATVSDDSRGVVQPPAAPVAAAPSPPPSSTASTASAPAPAPAAARHPGARAAKKAVVSVATPVTSTVSATLPQLPALPPLPPVTVTVQAPPLPPVQVPADLPQPQSKLP